MKKSNPPVEKEEVVVDPDEIIRDSKDTVEMVRTRLHGRGSLLNRPNKYGFPPLHYAIRKKCSEAVLVFLFQSKANPFMRDASGNTVLHTAVLMLDLERLHIICTLAMSELGYRVSTQWLNEQNKEGETALILTTTMLLKETHDYRAMRLAEIITILVRRGANLDLQDSKGNTAFHYLVEHGRRVNALLDMVKTMAEEYGGSLKIANNNGETVEVLLEKAKEEAVAAKENEKCVIRKANETKQDVVHRIKKGIKIDHQDSKGRTSIHRAIEWGCDETVLVIVIANGDLWIADNEGNTPLHLAASSSQYDVACKYVTGRAVGNPYYNGLLNKQNNHGETPLILAAKANNQVAIAGFFAWTKNVPFNPNIKDNLGNTFMHYEAIRLWNEPEMLSIYSGKGVLMTLPNNEGVTAMAKIAQLRKASQEYGGHDSSSDEEEESEEVRDSRFNDIMYTSWMAKSIQIQRDAIEINRRFKEYMEMKDMDQETEEIMDSLDVYMRGTLQELFDHIDNA